MDHARGYFERIGIMLPSPRLGGSKHPYSLGRESISTLLFSQPAKVSSTGE